MMNAGKNDNIDIICNSIEDVIIEDLFKVQMPDNNNAVPIKPVPTNLVALTNGYLRTNGLISKAVKYSKITPDNVISTISDFLFFNNVNNKLFFPHQQQQQSDHEEKQPIASNTNRDNLSLDIDSFLDETITDFVKSSPTEVLELMSSPDIFINSNEDEKTENNPSPFKIFTFDQSVITENCYNSSLEQVINTSPSYDQEKIDQDRLWGSQNFNLSATANSNGSGNGNGINALNANGNGNNNGISTVSVNVNLGGNGGVNINVNSNGNINGNRFVNMFRPNLNAPNPSFPGVVEYTPPPRFCWNNNINNQYPNRYENPNQNQFSGPYGKPNHGEQSATPRNHGGFIPHHGQCPQGPPMGNSRKYPNYGSMHIEQIISKQISILEMSECKLIERFMRDRIGSEYLQDQVRKLRSRNENISILIDYLKQDNVDVASLAFHCYGNYIISILFQYASVQQQTILFQEIIRKNVNINNCKQTQNQDVREKSKEENDSNKERQGFLVRLALSQSGCRVIQNMLESLSKEKENKKLLLQFMEWFEMEVTQSRFSTDSKNKTMDQLLTNCNGNHVIQKIVNLRLDHDRISFISNALNSDLIYYSEHKHACRVVQCFINNYGDELAIDRLLIDNVHLHLSCLPFGNYVIQCIIKCDVWYSEYDTFINFKNKFIDDLFTNKDDIGYLCFNKFGSNVMEKCIMCANKKQLNLLINSLCWNRCCGLNAMIPNEYANYVLSKLLIHCDQSQKESIANCVHNQITDLYDPYLKDNFKFGWEFLMKCHDIKYKMDQNYVRRQNKPKQNKQIKKKNNHNKNHGHNQRKRYYQNKRYYR